MTGKCEGTQHSIRQSLEQGGVVYVKCDYWKKKKKLSNFGWKFEANLLTRKAAKSALIYSAVNQAVRLRRSPGVMAIRR